MFSTISYIFFFPAPTSYIVSLFRIAFPFCLASSIFIGSSRERDRTTQCILVLYKPLQNILYLVVRTTLVNAE